MSEVTTKAKRLTRTQLYKFVRENYGKLYMEVTSSFDGMTDCVQSCEGGFHKVRHTPWSDRQMGIGAWCVLGGRDYIRPFDNGTMVGYSVSNCCGSFTVAVRKEEVAA